MTTNPLLERRRFLQMTVLQMTVLQTTAALAVGTIALRPSLAVASDTTPLASLNLIGPKEGYTPMVGTMVSMLNWMRQTVLRSVEGLKTSDLDFLIDNKANTIGAMLMHLAATETYYGLHTLGPTNNYCKWFHVCEHESNHNGQIKFLRKRIPGAPADGE